MKKLILSLFVILGTFSVYSQEFYSTKTNAFALWAKGGYSAFMNNLPETQPVGGCAGEIGLGYEYGTHGAGLLVQTGLSASILSSTLRNQDELTDSKRMYDTEGIEHTAYFTLNNIREKDRFINFHYTLLFGYQGYSGWYVLGGPKFGYALSGKAHTICDVTQDSRYDGIIGGDGDGLLSGMPNHYMGTIERTYDQPINKNFHIGLSTECGYSIIKKREVNIDDDPRKVDYTTCRIALFCEYGGYVNPWTSDNASLIVNKATDNQYLPVVRSYLFRNQTFVSTLFCGIKITYLLQHKRPVCVTCQNE